MTNLIQVSGSLTGDNCNEENIRSQSYFYPNEKWREEADQMRTGETNNDTLLCLCMCKSDEYLHTVLNIEHRHVATTFLYVKRILSTW